MCAVVPDLSAELPGSRRDDGRARRRHFALDYSSLGTALCPRIRAALVSSRYLAACIYETAVSVRGGTRYLYRAVDKYGKTVDALLCADRSELAAREFFTKVLKTHHPRWPTKLNLDGNAASHRALSVLRQENPDWQSVEIRSRRYLNNIVEQDHRAIKRRCAPMLAMKSFRTAATTLAGVKLAHRIRKGQFTLGSRGPHQFSSLKHAWARALARNNDGVTVREPVRRDTFEHDCTRTQQQVSAC
jgi:transposase-like protein